MSARTSFFILMVAPSVSAVLSRTCLPPRPPLFSSIRRLFLALVLLLSHSPVYLFLLVPPSEILPWPPLSTVPPPPPLLSSASLFLSPPPQLLLTSAGSTASFYLGANVLIACGRSSRPPRFPSSPPPRPPRLSSFSAWLPRGHRPPSKP